MDGPSTSGRSSGTVGVVLLWASGAAVGAAVTYFVLRGSARERSPFRAPALDPELDLLSIPTADQGDGRAASGASVRRFWEDDVLAEQFTRNVQASKQHAWKEVL